MGLLFFLSIAAKCQDCKGLYSTPTFYADYKSSPGKELRDLYLGGLVTINQTPYYFTIDTNDRILLRLENLRNAKNEHYVLEELGDNVKGLACITFIDDATFYFIGSDEESVVKYNFKLNKIEDKYSLASALRQQEKLYVRSDSKIQRLGNFLIVPTVFHKMDYRKKAIRQLVYQVPPFVLFDLKKNRAIKPQGNGFWPNAYRGDYIYPDFKPLISHNSKNEVYLIYGYSDTLVTYNVDREELKKSSLNLEVSFPRSGLPNNAKHLERRYKIENAQIMNYTYNSVTKSHIVAVKPSAEFVSNNRINSYFDINWYLYIFSASLKEEKRYCLNPKKDAEWYILSKMGDQLLMPSAIEKLENYQETRSFKALKLIKE